MRRVDTWVAVCVAILGACTAQAADRVDDARLVGKWVGGNEFFEVRSLHGGGGRYFSLVKTGGQALNETGSYAVAGNVITYTTQAGQAAKYTYDFEGDVLVLKGAVVLKMARESDAAAAEREINWIDYNNRLADLEWSKRFPLAKVKPGAWPMLKPLPQDAHAARVFPGATVFATMQAYVRFWNFGQTWVVTQGADPGGGRDQTRFYFLPNGRFLYRNIRYNGPVVPEGRPRRGTVEVTDAWGRYKVGPPDRGPAVREPLTLETDAGEVLDNALYDGRRNMQWGKSDVAGNEVWELFALQKGQGEKPKVPDAPAGVEDAQPLPKWAGPVPETPKATAPVKMPEGGLKPAPAANEGELELASLRQAIEEMKKAEAKMKADGADDATLKVLRDARKQLEDQLAAKRKPK